MKMSNQCERTSLSKLLFVMEHLGDSDGGGHPINDTSGLTALVQCVPGG